MFTYYMESDFSTYTYIENDKISQTIDKTLPEYWVPLPNSSLEAPKQVQLCQSVE